MGRGCERSRSRSEMRASYPPAGKSETGTIGQLHDHIKNNLPAALRETAGAMLLSPGVVPRGPGG